MPYRAPAELVMKPGKTHSEQVGIVVTALLEDQKLELVTWFRDFLTEAAAERWAWTLADIAQRDHAREGNGAAGKDDGITKAPMIGMIALHVRVSSINIYSFKTEVG